MPASVSAGIGSRAYAFIIDWHVRAIAAILWLGGALALGAASGFNWMAWAPPLAFYFLYHPVLEPLMDGQTPGKRYARLRVVRTDGARASAAAHLARNLMRLVDGFPGFYMLGAGVMMLREDQRRLGDLASDTIVIDESRPPPPAHAGTLPPQLAELLEEWLARYAELEPATRDSIALALLAKAPDPAVLESARRCSGGLLRAAVRDLLRPPA